MFRTIFTGALTRNLASALHGRSLPSGVTATSGASPADLAHLPTPLHAAFVSAYATSLQTVFRAAVPVGALAFLLSWTLKEVAGRQRMDRGVQRREGQFPAGPGTA